MSVLSTYQLEEQNAFQQRLFWAALRAMQLGCRIDLAERDRLAREIEASAIDTLQWIETVLGHKLNPRSFPQMQTLYYTDLGQKVVMTRAKPRQPSRPTTDDEALDTISKREPLLKPLNNKILHWRSLMTLRDTFLEARLDENGRMGCSFNICGTETYRFSSSENAFGVGMNLQNIPHPGSRALIKALERGERLPNIKRMFIPDEGYTFFEEDLDRAEFYVVVWEANDAELKLALKKGLDIHCFTACDIYGIKGIPPEELTETHPNYKEHRARIGGKRDYAKRIVHALDNTGTAKTVSATLNTTVQEAQRFINNWFGAHPGIPAWHERVKTQLSKGTVPFVQNAFGYKRFYFDRRDTILGNAAAWIPQSTVSCVINRGWVNLYEQAPEVQVLLQVHDSLGGQFPTDQAATLLPKINALSLITVPYPDPLVIPISIKTSTKSWGDCEAL
jgi:DNA polymerase-1